MRRTVCAVAAAILLIFAVVITADIAGIGGGKSNIDFNVSSGSGTSAVAAGLKSSGIISNKFVFKVYAHLTGEHVYQTGIHKLNSSMSYGRIIKELEKTPEDSDITILIPEGYELYRVADTLEEAGLINRDVFMREIETGSFDYPFIADIPQRENRLEGYLYPDTYKFSKNESEHDIINTMLANFNKNVIPVYEQSGSAYSLDDIIKLASVIEREAAGDEDRGKVASVFVNRLNIGMKLESCATVQYILKERKSVLSIEDTQINSPYNTYMNSGLPYGPIAAPGIKSIKAAISPESTSYLYFLATADGSRSLFAETYEQHLENQRLTQG